jgi:hypothetical protein
LEGPFGKPGGPSAFLADITDNAADIPSERRTCRAPCPADVKFHSRNKELP